MTNILNKYVSSSANQLCLTLAILLYLILIMMWISDWGVDWLCWSGYYAPLCPPNSPHSALPTPQLGELGTHQCTGLDKNIKTPNSTTQPTPKAHGQAAFRRLELSHVIFSQDWFGCGCLVVVVVVVVVMLLGKGGEKTVLSRFRHLVQTSVSL